MSAEMLAYSRAQGVFAGIDISGGVLRPDMEADHRAYGGNLSARDVVLGASSVKPPSEARAFTEALKRNARVTSGAK
jgi:lipid-binding SYLF domain-containing protein